MKLAFKTRDLFLGIVLMAAGWLCIQTQFLSRLTGPYGLPSFDLDFAFESAIWLSGGPLFGAGVGLPFKRPWVGGVIGGACQILFTAALMLSN
jgi:hypothetical protein